MGHIIIFYNSYNAFSSELLENFEVIFIPPNSSQWGHDCKAIVKRTAVKNTN